MSIEEKARQIAMKYVYGDHYTLTDEQEIQDMTRDISLLVVENQAKDNEVLGDVSERELTSEDLVWYEDVIYELDSIDGETAYITSLKCKTYETVRKEQLTLVR